MKFIDRLKEVFPRSRIEKLGEADTIYIKIPSSFYVKELAVYTAISLIANAIARSEIVVYQNGKRVENEDYFTLNIKPNPNESSSWFWHKVIEKTLRNPEGALCFIHNRQLFCADRFTVEHRRPFLGNVYSGVCVDGFQMDRKFTASQVFLFRLENVHANTMIANMYEEYGNIISTAMAAYKNANASKYILEVAGVQPGDAQFREEFEKILKNPLQQFVSGEKNILVQYDGKKLSQMKSENTNATSQDVIGTIEEVFKITGKAFHIPESLMLGNITNMNDVTKAFLTFAVDPYAEMIGETLTGQYGVENWEQGNRYEVDTTWVSHVDIFAMANDIDKLISSSFMSVDEVRERASIDPVGEEWSRKHIRTKNYESLDNQEKAGGEKSETETKQDDDAI